jgi:hypothetical protein
MRLKTFQMICLLACIAMAIPVLAFQKSADPLSGTWAGDWGPSASDRNQVTVDLKLAGKAVTGVVHTANNERPDVTLVKSTFDAATGAVHMEADAPGSMGAKGTVHFIIDGKLAGSTISGSWNHGTTKGDFKISKK